MRTMKATSYRDEVLLAAWPPIRYMDEYVLHLKRFSSSSVRFSKICVQHFHFPRFDKDIAVKMVASSSLYNIRLVFFCRQLGRRVNIPPCIWRLHSDGSNTGDAEATPSSLILTDRGPAVPDVQ
jgi:hypothetical protein